jgi:oligopeptide transport system permease protein
VSAAGATAEQAVDATWNGRRRGPWRRAAGRFVRRPLAVVALVVLAAIVVAGLLGGRLAPYPVNAIDLAHVNQAHAPTLAGRHWFGTDYLGRDLFSQTLYGLHTSLLAALAVAGAATLLGAFVGAVAGYGGGWIDTLLMRGIELIVSVPVIAVLLASLAYFAVLTPGRIALVLSLYLWTSVARVVRAACASLREREFVEAAHAAGASPRRIVLRHLLPNCFGTIVVAATSIFGIALTLEATLDFFGVGTQQSSTGGPTLGNLIADSSKFGQLQDAPWWTYTMPALVLIVLLTCVNFVADSFDDALD